MGPIYHWVIIYFFPFPFMFLPPLEEGVSAMLATNNDLASPDAQQASRPTPLPVRWMRSDGVTRRLPGVLDAHLFTRGSVLLLSAAAPPPP
jgi:hypothetical protein